MTEIPPKIAACWENHDVFHICGNPDLCEELDTRPPCDGWPGEFEHPHLRVVR